MSLQWENVCKSSEQSLLTLAAILACSQDNNNDHIGIGQTKITTERTSDRINE